MNGIHDMGGMTTFGPVPSHDGDVFHAGWERRFFAVAGSMAAHLAAGDEFRYAIERLDPTVYLSAGYYERWLDALERLCVEQGILTEEEMAAALPGWKPQPGVPPAVEGDAGIHAVDDAADPRYAVGDRVRVRNVNPAGHTRLPRYVRDRRGVVERVLGPQVLPDDLLLGRGPHRRPVYAVRFAAQELWGDGASPRDSVLIDLWEDYLLPDEEAV